MISYTDNTAMQLVRTQKDVLLRPLEMISRIVNRRHQLPILAKILLARDEVAYTSPQGSIEAAPSGQECESGAEVGHGDGGGSGDDGDGDGDGDPDCCRQPTSADPSDFSASRPPERAVQRNLPSVPTSASIISPPVGTCSRPPGFPGQDEVRLAALWMRSIFHRRSHWMALSLILASLCTAVLFASMDKDWLAALVLTKSIAIILFGFLRKPNDDA